MQSVRSILLSLYWINNVTGFHATPSRTVGRSAIVKKGTFDVQIRIHATTGTEPDPTSLVVGAVRPTIEIEIYHLHAIRNFQEIIDKKKNRR